MIFMTGFNIVFIMVMSAIPMIDWACHLFGLISGLLLGLWYFAPALGGAAFAHDAPSLVVAQRAALANARAISRGGALPAIPGAVVAGATASASSHWQGAGEGRSTGTSSSGGPKEGPSGVIIAMDTAADCLCHPITAINMACSPDAPRGLSRGAILSVVGLLAYFLLLALGFGLVYGGFLPFPQPRAGTAAGDEIYVPCIIYKFGVMLGHKEFVCPPPYNNLPF